MSSAMQHNCESPEKQCRVFPFDFGEVKLLTGPRLRLYYCYAPQGGFMYMRQTGLADYDAIMHNSARIINDKSWPNGAKLFMDLRWHDSSAFSFDTYFKLTREMATLYDKNERRYGVKASLCGNDSEYGMHRMFQSILEDGKRVLGAFRDIDEAVEFLEIDRELLDRIIAEVDKIESSMDLS